MHIKLFCRNVVNFFIDCEMCYTTFGSELARVTVIDCKNKPVYETLVLPDNPIIDYNSR